MKFNFLLGAGFAGITPKRHKHEDVSWLSSISSSPASSNGLKTDDALAVCSGLFKVHFESSAMVFQIASPKTRTRKEHVPFKKNTGYFSVLRF